MSNRKIFSIICLPIVVFLIVNMFLPFLVIVNGYGNTETYSLWRYFSEGREINGYPIIILIALIVAALLFVLQLCGLLKDAKLASYSIGLNSAFYFFALCDLIKNGGSEFGIGFWLGWIFSVILIILLIIGSLLSNESKPKNMYGNSNYGQPYGQQNNYGQQPAGYDPYTGKPYYR